MLKVNSNGEVSTKASKEIVTPIGKFSIGAGASEFERAQDRADYT